MTLRWLCDFSARVYLKHKSRMAYDYCDLKFLPFSVDGKHFMRFESENAISKFLRRSVDRALEFRATLS